MTEDLVTRASEYKRLYGAKLHPEIVEVPVLPYLRIDGKGAPDTDAYRAAVEALYTVSYAIRFALKNAGKLEYSVMPLQGLWWADSPGPFTSKEDRSLWRYTMMIAQPALADSALFEEALATGRKKKPGHPIDEVRLEPFAEGTVGQILHRGPYSEETPAIERLLAFVESQGYTVSGHHHEIYLSNPQRVEAAKLKTILRYPVEK